MCSRSVLPLCAPAHQPQPHPPNPHCPPSPPANLNTGGTAIPSLGLNSYDWWEEASTGVSNLGSEHTPTTKFAFPITTGMSFNRTLWQLTGRQIGHEARSLMNAGQAGSTFWAPVINLAREPRWGRNIEVPGEDPYQVGEYAEWFVKGFEQVSRRRGEGGRGVCMLCCVCVCV